MENNYDLEPSHNGLQEKVDKINHVKKKFFHSIQKKIGELLIDEISLIAEKEKKKKANIISLKVPYFLKPIFSFYNNDRLLIETSLYYIISSLNLMNLEMQVAYEGHLAVLDKSKSGLLELKGILRLNWNNMPEFDRKCEIAPNILPYLSIFDKELNNLIVFGMIKIFEWLSVLDSQICLEKSSYAQSFTRVLESLT